MANMPAFYSHQLPLSIEQMSSCWLGQQCRKLPSSCACVDRM